MLRWAGGQRDESCYIFEQILDSATTAPNGETKFCYHVAGTSICRTAFCRILGLAGNNSRVRKYETLIRRGNTSLPPKKPGRASSASLGLEALAEKWIQDFVVLHAEKSPSEMVFSLDKHSIVEVHGQYKVHFGDRFVLKLSTFRKVWHKTLKKKIPEPLSGKLFSVQHRKRRAVGFKKCDKCCALQHAVSMAKTRQDRETAQHRFKLHLAKMRNNRDALNAARVQCNGKTVVGFSIDAWDINKCTTPTTKVCVHVCMYDVCMNACMII